MAFGRVEPYEIEAWLGGGWSPGEVKCITRSILAWERGHFGASETERDEAWTRIAMMAVAAEWEKGRVE